MACCRFVRPLDSSCSSLVSRFRMDLSKTIEGLPNSATGYFGSMAESYDSLIHRAVPRYDEMIARLLDYLPGNPRRVLELGSGTGPEEQVIVGRRSGVAIQLGACSRMTERHRGERKEILCLAHRH